MISHENSKPAIAIGVSDVGKCYHLYERPQDRLKQAIYPLLQRKLRMSVRHYGREFWALRNVSLSVQRGEAVGVVGRNGAGKSTLLQIIAGTLAPTSGSVEIKGSVAALLELGTGFSPDFTGRENVYLNASLLGLSREETDARFDDIAAFADIGTFIDQPVKTYSSGMLLRLAFSVQTAVSPQILIIDEALAVGDAFFQAKCMARLRRLLHEGVTILFVSHDIGTVRQLCSKAVLLNDGVVLDYGPVQQVTDHYQRLDFEERNRSTRERSEPAFASSCEVEQATGSLGIHTEPLLVYPELIGNVAEFRERNSSHRSGNGTAQFINVTLMKNGNPLEVFDYGDVVTLRQITLFRKTLDHVNVCYKIRSLQGVDIVFGDTRLTGDIDRRYEEGQIYVFEWTFKLDLMHGSYTVLSGLAHPPAGNRDDWCFIDVVPTSVFFHMTPRKSGMIDAFIVWENSISIKSINELQKTQS